MTSPAAFTCETCGGIASFGFGRVNGKTGHWYCSEHQTAFVVERTPPPPPIIIPEDIKAMLLWQVQAALREGTDKRRAELWARIDELTNRSD